MVSGNIFEVIGSDLIRKDSQSQHKEGGEKKSKNVFRKLGHLVFDFHPSFFLLGSARGLEMGWLSISFPTVLAAREKNDEEAADDELGDGGCTSGGP